MNKDIVYNHKTNKKANIKKEVLAWIIAIPSLLLFAFFLWGPLLQNIVFSFAKTSNFDMEGFNGLQNYIHVFNDPRFTQALGNTVLYVIYSLLIGFIVPIILALL